MSLAELRALDEGEVSSHEVAAEGIETFLQGVFKYVDDKAEQKAVLEHVIESSLQSSLTLLSMGYVVRQPGYTSRRAEENLSWEASAEPEPCEADPWARTALEVRVRAPKVAIVGDKPMSAGRTRGKSVAAGRSRRLSTSSRQPSASRRSAASARSRPGSAVPSEERPGGSPPAASPPPTPGTRARRDRAAAERAARAQGDEMENRLRKELELRRQAEAAAQKAAQRQEEEKARLKAMKKELRGRDYTYDFRGEVVLLARVDAERLPSAMLTPEIDVTSEKPEQKSADRQVSRTGTYKADVKSKRPLEEKSGPTAPLDRLERAQDYIPQESDGPTVHHDVIRLTGGVTLREGTSTRMGPKLTSYGDKLTREAYLLRSGKAAELEESEEDVSDDEGPSGPSRPASARRVPEEMSADSVTKQVVDMLKEPEALTPTEAQAAAAGKPLLPAWAQDAIYVPPESNPSAPASLATTGRRGASRGRSPSRGSPSRGGGRTPARSRGGGAARALG